MSRTNSLTLLRVTLGLLAMALQAPVAQALAHGVFEQVLESHDIEEVYEVNGQAWALVAGSLVRLSPSEETFVTEGLPTAKAVRMMAPLGKTWAFVTPGQELFRIEDDDSIGKIELSANLKEEEKILSFLEIANALWLGTTHGLYRIPMASSGSPGVSRLIDGEQIHSLQAGEGTVWVGGSDRIFRATIEGEVEVLSGEPIGGAVRYFVKAAEGLVAITNKRIGKRRSRRAYRVFDDAWERILRPEKIQEAYAVHDDLWFVTDEGLVRSDGHKELPPPFAPEVNAMIRDLVVRRDGEIWAVTKRDIFRIADGEPEHINQARPTSSPAWLQGVTEAGGRIWLWGRNRRCVGGAHCGLFVFQPDVEMKLDFSWDFWGWIFSGSRLKVKDVFYGGEATGGRRIPRSDLEVSIEGGDAAFKQRFRDGSVFVSGDEVTYLLKPGQNLVFTAVKDKFGTVHGEGPIDIRPFPYFRIASAVIMIAVVILTLGLSSYRPAEFLANVLERRRVWKRFVRAYRQHLSTAAGNVPARKISQTVLEELEDGARFGIVGSAEKNRAASLELAVAYANAGLGRRWKPRSIPVRFLCDSLELDRVGAMARRIKTRLARSGGNSEEVLNSIGVVILEGYEALSSESRRWEQAYREGEEPDLAYVISAEAESDLPTELDALRRWDELFVESREGAEIPSSEEPERKPPQ